MKDKGRGKRASNVQAADRGLGLWCVVGESESERERERERGDGFEELES